MITDDYRSSPRLLGAVILKNITQLKKAIEGRCCQNHGYYTEVVVWEIENNQVKRKLKKKELVELGADAEEPTKYCVSPDYTKYL